MPDYPDSAYQRGDQGTVKIAIFVTPADTTSDAYVQTSSGHAELDAAALAAAKASQYRAGIEDCEPVGNWIVLPYTFRSPATGK